jgi:hypothetical protein
LRLFFISLGSALAGTCAGMAALYVLHFVAGLGGEAPSVTDLQSFALLMFVPAFLLCLLLYAPALLWLARRRSCEPPRLFVLVPAFLLNLPVFLALLFGLLRGGMFFGAGEVVLFAAAFAAAGATFGRGFVWWCRKKSREE